MKLVQKAYAKANIFLTVPGRLINGYHLIRTVIVPLYLCDEVIIEVKDGEAAGGEPVRIICTTNYSDALKKHLASHAVGADKKPLSAALTEPLNSDSNICIRAARLLINRLGLKKSVAITLNKQVPIGAGLGGGSADAAAVIVGLTRLSGADLSLSELCKLGATLGADVPAAILSRPVIVYGSGGLTLDLSQCLKPEFAHFITACGVVIVKPPYPVMTGEAYAGLGHQPELPDELAWSDDFKSDPRAMRLLSKIAAVESLSPDQGCENSKELTSPGDGGNSLSRQELFSNDFETSVFGRHPDLGRLARILTGGGAIHAFLAGSGSSIVGLFQSPAEAEQWAKRFCQSEPYLHGEFRGAFVETTAFRLNVS